MPSTLFRTALIASLLSMVSIPLAHAQAHTDWPASSIHTYGTVAVVTVSDPGIRHHCRVHAITIDTLVCGVGFARKPVIYQRDDVAALIEPPSHSSEPLVLGCLSIAIAGTVAAAVFLPPLAAVAIGIPSMLIGFTFAMVTDDDSHDETLLYQRPNTPLTVTVRSY
jgi:hypothetical protein